MKKLIVWQQQLYAIIVHLALKKTFASIVVKIIGEEVNWCRCVTAVHLVLRKINASTAEIIIGEEEQWQDYVTAAHLGVKEISV